MRLYNGGLTSVNALQPYYKAMGESLFQVLEQGVHGGEMILFLYNFYGLTKASQQTPAKLAQRLNFYSHRFLFSCTLEGLCAKVTANAAISRNVTKSELLDVYQQLQRIRYLVYADLAWVPMPHKVYVYVLHIHIF